MKYSLAFSLMNSIEQISTIREEAVGTKEINTSVSLQGTVIKAIYKNIYALSIMSNNLNEVIEGFKI